METITTMADDDVLNIQIFIPELHIQKCLAVSVDEKVWEVKGRLIQSLQDKLPQSFNYGLFLPPCDGRAGKFLLEDRSIREYPFHDCVPYLELKYKKRVYKMLSIDEKQLEKLHSKSNLKKFMNLINLGQLKKVEEMCRMGFDPNYHDNEGRTPLTMVCALANSESLIKTLVEYGAHIDFRNTDGQTAMHKAAYWSLAENVNCLLELGASPNYRDPLGLTPLYYNMLQSDSKSSIAQMLLYNYSDINITDLDGNHELHQACKNGLVQHVDYLIYYGAEINAQNINGNTPLHVCAIHNKPNCARLLLFRGANSTLLNKQGQTSLDVAQILGSYEVSQVILNYDPASTVPYNSKPTFNPKRRPSISSGQRSSSQASVCSSEYRSVVPISPTPSQMSTSSYKLCPGDISAGNYSTMRRYPAYTLMNRNAFEVNVPRTVVIPRDAKGGFGFVLRGATSVGNFTPTLLNPALQRFEGIDLQGMAMKAGLRPGDFLLQVNGNDVRSATHEHVHQLIQSSTDSVTLKVITIDPGSFNFHPSHTMPVNISRSDKVGDMYGYGISTVPLHSTKSVEALNQAGYERFASVKQRINGSKRISMEELERLMERQGQSTSQFQPLPIHEDVLTNGSGLKFNSVNDLKRYKKNGLHRTALPALPPANGHCMRSFNSSPDLQRTTDNAPILRASFNGQQFKPDVFTDPEGISDYSRPFRPNDRPKTPAPAPPPPPPLLDNFTASSSTGGDTLRNNLSSMIPPSTSSTSLSQASTPTSGIEINLSPPPVQQKNPAPAPPPPPPPPPAPPLPPQQFSGTAATTKSTSLKSAPNGESGTLPISNEILSTVKLKPTIRRESGNYCAVVPNGFDSDLRNALAKRRGKIAQSNNNDASKKVVFLLENPPAATVISSYGGLNLRDETIPQNVQTSTKWDISSKSEHSPTGITSKKDSGYASSRTSLEPSECGEDTGSSSLSATTITLAEPTKSISHITVPDPTCHVSLISNQFEGCTRKSILQVPTSSSVQQGAQVISDHDSMSLNSTLSTLSGQLSSSDRQQQQLVANVLSSRSIPQKISVNQSTTDCNDDEADSGTGDSDNDVATESSKLPIDSFYQYAIKFTDNQAKNSSMSKNFIEKEVANWTTDDIIAWLKTLGLSEHSQKFQQFQINGAHLLSYDRSFLTQLGVTRIGHRQLIERSLKSLMEQ